jgi:hypothetical protein
VRSPTSQRCNFWRSRPDRCKLTPTLTWKAILAFDPCAEERDAIRRKLAKAFPDYRTRALTLADAAAAGASFDQLIWAAGRAAEADPDCARRIRLFGADCAARVAHIANDPRSTAAIVAPASSPVRPLGEIDAAAWDAAWAAALEPLGTAGTPLRAAAGTPPGGRRRRLGRRQGRRRRSGRRTRVATRPAGRVVLRR